MCIFGNRMIDHISKSTEGTLWVDSARRISIHGKRKANVEDYKTPVNILPIAFGWCSSPVNPKVIAAHGNPVPCTPELERWDNGKLDVLVEGEPALTSHSITTCHCGGWITFVDDGQCESLGSVEPVDSDGDSRVRDGIMRAGRLIGGAAAGGAALLSALGSKAGAKKATGAAALGGAMESARALHRRVLTGGRSLMEAGDVATRRAASGSSGESSRGGGTSGSGGAGRSGGSNRGGGFGSSGSGRSGGSSRGGGVSGGANRIEATPELTEHIINVDPSGQRRNGISGAHNSVEFFKNDVEIVSRTPHPSMEGVETIEYHLPKLDRTGQPIPGEYQSGRPYTKTIYDPSIISDDEFISRGIEAANDALANSPDGTLSRTWEGTDSYGVPWRGHFENGEITTMYPK